MYETYIKNFYHSTQKHWQEGEREEQKILAIAYLLVHNTNGVFSINKKADKFAMTLEVSQPSWKISIYEDTLIKFYLFYFRVKSGEKYFFKNACANVRKLYMLENLNIFKCKRF